MNATADYHAKCFAWELGKRHPLDSLEWFAGAKHGIKRAQFPNLLVVLERGWSLYNFDNFLKWSANPTVVLKADSETYERNRNLFYVACSRLQERLALLFTQELSPLTQETLGKWFGKENIWEMTKI